jgi:hypothetical protein
MSAIEILVWGELEIGYPTIFNCTEKRVDNDGLATRETIPRDPKNVELANTALTQLMKAKYSKSLQDTLECPIFLLDGHNKASSNIVYDLFKQILDRYWSTIEQNQRLQKYLTYIDPQYNDWDDQELVRERFCVKVAEEERALTNCDKDFWKKRIKIWWNPHELISYLKQWDIFQLLAKCTTYSYCYLLNPWWLTPHEQKIFASILERWSLKVVGNRNAKCFLKINNIRWVRYTKIGFNDTYLKDSHDYNSCRFDEKDMKYLQF